MTAAQRRHFREHLLCACGHPRDAHRYTPQPHACPLCECTGAHFPGQPMPVPEPPPEPKPEPVRQTHRPRLRAGGLALLLGLAAMGGGVPYPEPNYPTKRRALTCSNCGASTSDRTNLGIAHAGCVGTFGEYA